jgi:2-polyprenyl-6-methoxyphenol hydroxylase-like FAD-dependent oxidoreductase
MNTSPHVVVVGAGPTGLALAGELAMAGVRCTVLERRATESNVTRAFAVHARTLELLDSRGMADELLRHGVALREIQGLPGTTLDLSELDSRFPVMLIAPQSATETLLEERATRLGVDILRGTEIVGLHQDATMVQVEVRGPGGAETMTADYLVGCDGAHSRVRDLVGIGFTGEEYATHIILADVPIAEPPAEALFGRTSGDGLVVVVPFGDGWFRVILWDRRREDVPLDQPVTADEVRDGMRRIAGTDMGMGVPRWSSRFLSERRQAERYRAGRVFLAGDAAHVHSPLGGQGMNTGIGDAMNLGWKLAAEISGTAPDWLLDSYQVERHRVGAQVLALTDRFNAMVLSSSRVGAWLRPLLMRAVLKVGPTRRRMLGMLSQLGIRYPSGRGDHRLAGRPVRDLATEGGRLYEVLRSGRFVLLREADGTDLAEPWAGRIVSVRPTTPGQPAVQLIRPDGYVAWAADRSDPAEIEAALEHWCGPRTDGRVLDSALRSAGAHRSGRAGRTPGDPDGAR